METAISVLPNDTIDVPFDLIPAFANVRVIAQDELGNLLPGVYTHISPCFVPQGCSLGSTDENGISVGSFNAGTYTIEVWKGDFQSYKEQIDLTAFYTSENPLVINATLVGNPGTIKIASNLSGAMVYLAAGDKGDVIDDPNIFWEEIGTTPTSITKIQGNYTIKAFREGYKPVTLPPEVDISSVGYPYWDTFYLEPGQTKYIDIVQFIPLTGEIEIISNVSDAQVFLNDEVIGRLSSGRKIFENIPIGTHALTVNKENYSPLHTNVVINYRETTTIQANLYLPQSLTAEITMSPTYGKPPLEVHFTGEGAGPAGTSIVSYQWDFGDGSFSSSQNPTHTYQEAGQYQVKLIITDQHNDTASKDVYVNVLSGDQIIENPVSGCLTISADSMLVETGSITYTGNVLLNGFLRVKDSGSISGSINVQDGPSGEITGKGDIITEIGSIDSGIAAINTAKSFILKPKQSDTGGCYREITFDSNPSNFSFTMVYYGLSFEVSNLKLYDNRLTLSGKLSSFANLLGEVGLAMSVSHSGFDFGGKIKLPGFKIGSFGIKDAYLEIDTGCGNCWGAGIKFGLPPGVGIEVGGELGIRNGNLNKVSAEADSLDLPIGNTGVFLGSINGGLEHIPPDPDPLILKAGAGFYTGPKITVPSLNLLDGFLKISGGELNLIGADVDLEIDCSGKFSAQGLGYLLDKDFLEIGKAELTVDLNKGFYAQGVLKYPPGSLALLEGNLAGKIDFDLEFQASVVGTVQVPPALPIIGGMRFGQAAGYIDNDLIAAGVSIGDEVCLPVIGCYDLYLPVCLIFSFDDWDFSVATNWDAIQEVSLTGLPNEYAYYAPLQFVGAGLPLFPLAQSFRNPTVEQAFEVPKGLEVVIFYLQVPGKEIVPEFSVISPDGTIYKRDSIASVWQYNEKAGDCWCAVPHPKPGTWIIKPDDSLSGLKYHISIFKLNKGPEIELLTPINNIIAEVGTQIPITWKAEDPDSDAMIRLCYTESPLLLENKELPAFPGNTIAKNLSEDNPKSNYTWNTKGVAPGKYHIYAVITDNKNFPVFARSKGTVTLTRSDFPPPKGVKAHQNGPVLIVEWDGRSGADGYHVYYQDFQEQTPLVLAPSLSIWGETMAELRNLPSGKYQIAVTAFTENGLESDYSKPIEVDFRK